MRIFLDANILFSAAKSDGAVRQLLTLLAQAGHTLVADGFVAAEAQRNLAANAPPAAVDALQALLAAVELAPAQRAAPTADLAAWLPDKDRPVLLAAIALGCDALVTGDRTHFGAGYGRAFGPVTVHSPALLAERLPG
ncbi:MAG: PIN domain-containing protein [Hydrogenophaga sp.]|nr:PIN domain-containing protein [Burkholderiaceae bacterium]MDZ4123197.1 PIN domain-containing protein [Hydrogenophaga sp.]